MCSFLPPGAVYVVCPGEPDVPPTALPSALSHAQWDTPPCAAGPAGKYIYIRALISSAVW